MQIENYGNYQLLKRLATGGMAQIYLARQKGPEGFEKLLVVKRILPHLAENADFVQMFLDEARIAARLNHPNIVQIFNLGAQDDSYFIAMEYIHGEDVRRVWKRAEALGKTMPIQLVCRVIMEACAGLDYAHKRTDQNGKPLGIVHRDVSPQNILVTFEGGVKIVDFGIAKAADQATITRSGVLKGKYSYMSPEQASGKKLDCRSDIFALGVVLHELLTGQRLFKRSNDIQTLHAVAQCEVSPPSELNPRVPKDLDVIVLKALAQNPEDRYQEAAHLEMALEEWLLQHHLPSSSVHLAAFMEDLYAERLAHERRVGEVVVEEVDGRLEEEGPAVPSNSGRGRSASSGDGRLPSPRERLTDPAIRDHATTAERRLRQTDVAAREAIFGDLLKSASLGPSTSGPTNIASVPPPDAVPENATISVEPQAPGAFSYVQTHTTESGGRPGVPTLTASGTRARRRAAGAAMAVLFLLSVMMGAGGYALYRMRPQARGGVGDMATVRALSEPPGATIIFNGQQVPETTPCTLPRVPAGTYPISMGKAGYQDYQGTVTVPERGEVQLAMVHLVPEIPFVDVAARDGGAAVEEAQVELTVTSEPLANLWLDGRDKGPTPFTYQVKPNTDVDVRLEAHGYQPLVRRVHVGDESREERFTLERIVQAAVHPVAHAAPRGRGKVRFAVTPWANVTCASSSGSFDFGPTPFKDKELPAGVYQCRFAHPEHPTRTERVEVRPNTVNKVSVKF